MRSQLACYSQVLFLVMSIAAAGGCVTSNGGTDESAVNETGDPSLEGDDNVPVPKNEKLVPGPIDDIDMKEMVYQGIEKQLVATETEQTRVEIGDFESYKFSIIKMTKNGEDVTGMQTEAPDRLLVEVSGWYKRTAKTGDDPDEKCFSFETKVALAEGDSWVYDDKEPLTFIRENSEDCY